MSNPITITFTVASFPVGWTGNYDQFAQELVSLMSAVIQGDIMPGLYSQGVVTLPSTDVGPVIMGGQIYLWSTTSTPPGYQLYVPESPVNTRSYNVLDNGDFSVWQRNPTGLSAVNIGPLDWWSAGGPADGSAPAGSVSWVINHAGGYTVPAVNSSVVVTVISSANAVAGSTFYPGNNIITELGDQLSVTAVPTGVELTLTNTGGATPGNNITDGSTLYAYPIAYLADRWAVFQDGTITNAPLQEQFPASINGGIFNDNLKTQFCLRVTANSVPTTPSSGQYCVITQRLERQIAEALFQQTPSLQFGIRTSIAGIFCAFLQNAGATQSLVVPFTVTGSGTWQWFKFPALATPTSATGNWGTDPADFSMMFGICLSAGTTFQGSPAQDNIWQTGNLLCDSNQVNFLGNASATLDVALAQLEPNPVCTLFDYRPFPTQVFNCQRYYSKSYDYDVVPGTALSQAAGGVFTATGTSNAVGSMKFPREMRIIPPMINLFSPYSGIYGKALQNTGSSDFFVTGWSGADTRGFVQLTSNTNFNTSDLYTVETEEFSDI